MATTSSDMMNRETYEKHDVVEFYSHQKELQPAERLILSTITPFIKGKLIVDIGIGGGRTTSHLVSIADKYVGIDTSSEMINSCKKHYNSDKASFLVCDARDLNSLESNSVDFVLFSFNGIDCIPYRDRWRVFKGIYRILKIDGYFAFSTHNVRNIESLYSFHFSKHPFRFLYQVIRYLKIKKINGPIEKYKNKDWFSIRDGAEDFQTEVVYVKPEKQINELSAFGFRNSKFFSNQNNSAVSLEQVKESPEAWIYILCQK